MQAEDPQATELTETSRINKLFDRRHDKFTTTLLFHDWVADEFVQNLSDHHAFEHGHVDSVWSKNESQNHPASDGVHRQQRSVNRQVLVSKSLNLMKPHTVNSRSICLAIPPIVLAYLTIYDDLCPVRRSSAHGDCRSDSCMGGNEEPHYSALVAYSAQGRAVLEAVSALGLEAIRY